MADRTTLFFQFPVKGFVDDVYNAVNDYVLDGIDELDRVVQSEATTAKAKKEVQKGMDTLQKRLQEAIDVHFGKFEAYITRNIFGIPEKLVIPEADLAGSSAQYTEEDETTIDAELEELRAELKSTLYLNANLKAQITQSKDVLAVLKATESMCKELEKAGTDKYIRLRELTSTLATVRTSSDASEEVIADIKRLSSQLARLTEPHSTTDDQVAARFAEHEEVADVDSMLEL